MPSKAATAGQGAGGWVLGILVSALTVSPILGFANSRTIPCQGGELLHSICLVANSRRAKLFLTFGRGILTRAGDFLGADGAF